MAVTITMSSVLKVSTNLPIAFKRDICERLSEVSPDRTGLFLRSGLENFLFKEWKRRDTTPGWVIFTFLSHLLTQTRLISKRAAAILLKLHGNRDQFAWCRRKTVVYGHGWVILVIISIHYHVTILAKHSGIVILHTIAGVSLPIK